MKRSVLIITESDPRNSGRTAEAVRMAAGLSTHDRLAVTLCLCGPAIQVLHQKTEDLVDGDSFDQYIPVLAEGGAIVHVESPITARGVSNAAKYSTSIDESKLGKLVAASERVIHF
jgi:hypothetical protein